MAKRILILVAIALILAVCVNIQGIPYTVDITTTALRFSEEDTVPSEIVVGLKGGIIRRLIGSDTFEGRITIGSKQHETGTKQLEITLDLNERTPVIREYIGSQLSSYGMFLLIDGNFNAAAIKVSGTPHEYIIWGMTVEEFLAQEMR